MMATIESYTKRTAKSAANLEARRPRVRRRTDIAGNVLYLRWSAAMSQRQAEG